jgi:hypothetical protein
MEAALICSLTSFGHFVLGCGSSVPDEDDALFAQMAERFEFLGG